MSNNIFKFDNSQVQMKIYLSSDIAIPDTYVIKGPVNISIMTGKINQTFFEILTELNEQETLKWRQECHKKFSQYSKGLGIYTINSPIIKCKTLALLNTNTVHVRRYSSDSNGKQKLIHSSS